MSNSLTTKMLTALRWHHRAVQNRQGYAGTDADKLTRYILEQFKDTPNIDVARYSTVEDFINDQSPPAFAYEEEAMTFLEYTVTKNPLGQHWHVVSFRDAFGRIYEHGTLESLPLPRLKEKALQYILAKNPA